jgi:hypothetical protein
MTSLDTIARASADAVHESVSSVQVPIGAAGAAASAAASFKVAGYALAGAAAGVAVVAALIVAAPTEVDPASQTTSSLVTSTSVISTSTAPVPSTVAAPTEEPIIPVAPISEVPVETTPPPTTSEAVPDTTPPALAVTSPGDNEHVTTKVVSFRGTTEPGATVTASGKFGAAVAADGSWEIDLVVAAGANGVVFSAKDAAGNESAVRMTIHLDVEEELKEPTTTTTEVAWEFSATQKFGNCSEPIPYDVFSGSAKPGTTVTISSPYGGGTVEAGAEGGWSLKVHFPEAPSNVPFVVTVADSYGATRTFEFVSLYEG